MIISLAQDRIREAAKAAACEQAWTDARGVRGVPMRIQDSTPARAAAAVAQNCDLTAVYEFVDRADALEWRGSDLTVRARGDWTRIFTIFRGDDAQADVVASGELDWMLQLAGQLDTPPVPATVLVADEAIAFPRVSGPVPVAVHDVLQTGRALRLAWEVDDADGRPIYRGADLELAEEIYHLAPAGAHLIPAGVTGGEWS